MLGVWKTSPSEYAPDQKRRLRSDKHPRDVPEPPQTSAQCSSWCGERCRRVGARKTPQRGAKSLCRPNSTMVQCTSTSNPWNLQTFLGNLKPWNLGTGQAQSHSKAPSRSSLCHGFSLSNFVVPYLRHVRCHLSWLQEIVQEPCTPPR